MSLLGLPQEKVIACPLHADTVPSLHVYGDGESWYCFSARCRKGGDVIALVAAVRKCSMKAATLWLAGELGLSVDYRSEGAVVKAIQGIIERASVETPRRDPSLKTYLEQRFVFVVQDWQRMFREGRWPDAASAVQALESATERLLAAQAQCRSLRDPRIVGL